jgi:putative FmdB family regulatory protein
LTAASAKPQREEYVPTYQYACTDCGERSEVVQRFTDDPLTVCSACAGKLRKVFSPVGIVFKGSGFYRTDSRGSSTVSAGKDGGPNGSSADGSSAEGSSAKSDSGKSSESSGSSNGSGSDSGSGGSGGSGGSSGSGGSGRSGGSGDKKSSVAASSAK